MCNEWLSLSYEQWIIGRFNCIHFRATAIDLISSPDTETDGLYKNNWIKQNETRAH